MRLYLDTSALLRAEVERDLGLRETIGAAAQLFACRLLHVETARAMHRLKRERPKAHVAIRAAEQSIAAALAACLVAQFDEAVLARAALDFPIEPVRSLDAIHLAAALWWREKLGVGSGDVLAFASSDDRMRANAAALGFPLIPA